LSIDFFLAHNIDKTTSAYFKNDIESLKNQYITCIDDLSIENTEVRVLESEDKKRLSQMEIESRKQAEQIAALQRQLGRKDEIENKPPTFHLFVPTKLLLV